MTTKKLTKLLALYLPYILLGLVATNFGEAWRLAEGKELGDKIMSMMGTIPVAFANPLPSLHPLDLLVGLCCGAGLRLAVYLRGKNAKKYRHGMEYGSARWGTPKDIEPFMAPKFADNIILTKTERLMMSNRPPDPKNARNKNVLVVGGSGSGKTRFWLKPNLLQCHSSYVVTDPKGTIVLECGQAMLKNGYKVKILNTINFKKSMHYNPFSYVHSEKDILKLVTTLMTNTKGEGSGGDPFWEKSERLLLTALIAYLHYEAPVEEQNFATLLEMLNTMQVLEDDEEYQNPVDLLFEELAKKKPNSFAGRQYKLYKLAAGKTAKSILISCGARLAPFDIQELRDLTMYDELQLDTLGDKKTALFLIMSDTDSTFNFLISMKIKKLGALLVSAVLCAGMAAPAFAFEGEAAPVEQPVLPEVVEDIVTVTDETSGALTPEGNLTLVDDYHTSYSDGSGQQFITLVSKSGNTFYLVIDRNAKGQQTVHFMNLVDEADLLALMEEEAADAYTAEKEAAAQAELDRLKAEEEAKKVAEEAATAEPPKENKVTKYAGAFLGVVALIALAAGGGFYFYRQQMQKKKAEKEALDPDANYTEDKGDFEIPTEDEPEDTGKEDNTEE